MDPDLIQKISRAIMFNMIICFFFSAGLIAGWITSPHHPGPLIQNCTTITPVCEDRSSYYINYIDSNYIIKCPVKPEIMIRDPALDP